MVELGFESAMSYGVFVDIGFETSMSTSQIEIGFETGATYSREIEVGFETSTLAISEDLFETISPMTEQFWTATENISPPIDVPLVEPVFILNTPGGTIDLSPYLLELSVTRRLEGKATFSATFLQHSIGGFTNGAPTTDLFSALRVKPTALNPLFRGTGSFFNKILSHKHDFSRTITISFKVTKPGGVTSTYNMPLFLGGTPSLDTDGKLQWDGESLIAVLEPHGGYKPDIVPGDNKISYAHAAIRTLAGERLITNVKLNFPDYPIRQLRLSSGNRRGWIDSILEPYQAHMREFGNGLICEPARDVNTQNADWAWQDYLNMMDFSVQQQEGFYNKLIVARTRDQSGIVSDSGEPNICRGGQCVGIQRVSVTNPSNNVVILVKRLGASQITFKDFNYLDEFGASLSGITQAQFFASASKIHSIEFVSQPYFFIGTTPTTGQGSSGGPSNDPNSLSAFVPEYEWTIYGGSEASATTSSNPIDEYAEAFSYQVSDSATIDIWGELPHEEHIEMDVIPNGTVAQAAARALLFENVRKIFQANWSTPYVNPWAEPNDIHEVRHKDTGNQRVKFLQEEDTIRWSAEGGCTQEFTCTRGLLS